MKNYLPIMVGQHFLIITSELIVLSNVLDFILRHELGENVLVSRKTAKVDEQIELT